MNMSSSYLPTRDLIKDTRFDFLLSIKHELTNDGDTVGASCFC